MRWTGQLLSERDAEALPGMTSMGEIVDEPETPGFAAIRFHEVRCRSALNRVPAASRVPVRWTINPYRGCSHACVYCFARRSHEYLDLDAGSDFDTQVVVKTNLVEVLERELRRPGWEREHVALGTNTDPYQRAEGRYRLMPGVIRALAASGTPFSILTKGTMLTRDLDLLAEAATRVPVGVSISLATMDDGLRAGLEPGAPSPAARLELVRRIRAAGLPCGVLVAPLLPGLTDTGDRLERLVEALADAGATDVSGLPLRLVPGAREWFLAWLGEHRPDLVDLYRRLYGGGAAVRASYATDLAERLDAAVAAVTLDEHPGPVSPWKAGRALTAAPRSDVPTSAPREATLF
jgi:DNA repair photolyase